MSTIKNLFPNWYSPLLILGGFALITTGLVRVSGGLVYIMHIDSYTFDFTWQGVHYIIFGALLFVIFAFEFGYSIGKNRWRGK